MRQKRLLAPKDIPVLAGLLLLCALGFWLLSRSPGGTTAVVEKNGEIILRRDLSQLDGPEETVLQGENGLSLTVAFYPDGAAVTRADCPDQVCLRTGKLTRAGETAVCLPARVSLRLEGGSGADAETY